MQVSSKPFVAAIGAVVFVGLTLLIAGWIHPYCGFPLAPGFYIAGLVFPTASFSTGFILTVGLSIDVCIYTYLFLALPKLGRAFRESDFARRYPR
jgi:hypothetical protein